MLKIIVPGTTLWDEVNEVFIETEDTELILEHSLVSVSKWEAIWHKSFVSNKEKSVDEIISYIECMCMNDTVDTNVFKCLTKNNVDSIVKYIEEPMTATCFPYASKKRTKREAVTSELIYYWMVALNIPMECQYWHLNRLLTLIHVCEIKSTPPKKMSRREIMERNKMLNDKRRKELNSKG